VAEPVEATPVQRTVEATDKAKPVESSIAKCIKAFSIHIFCFLKKITFAIKNMKGFMYILECADGTYYTGSTNDLDLRIKLHQNGDGANHTKKRLPVKLVYFEEFQRIDEAFYREKQVQGWSRAKKEALIKEEHNKLPELSKNYTQKCMEKK